MSKQRHLLGILQQGIVGKLCKARTYDTLYTMEFTNEVRPSLALRCELKHREEKLTRCYSVYEGS